MWSLTKFAIFRPELVLFTLHPPCLRVSGAVIIIYHSHNTLRVITAWNKPDTQIFIPRKFIKLKESSHQNYIIKLGKRSAYTLLKIKPWKGRAIWARILNFWERHPKIIILYKRKFLPEYRHVFLKYLFWN